VFPQGSASFATVLAQVRLAVFREAARADLPGLIFTMVYTRSKDAFIAGAVEAMEIQDGQVCFVRLTCAPETLEDRVRDESRQHQDKLTTSDSLRTYMAELADQAPWAAVRGRPSLSIDTDALSPRAAAEAIVSHYGLARFDGQPSPGGPGGVRT
jgi:hypothetical protein